MFYMDIVCLVGHKLVGIFVRVIRLIDVITMIVHLYVINAESLKENYRVVFFKFN